MHLAQSQKYIPVTTNAPFFVIDNLHEKNISVSFNNYGLSINTAIQMNRGIYTGSVQLNNGDIHFNPLGIRNDFAINPHVYVEAGMGKLLDIPVGNFTASGGLGYEFSKQIPRAFVQFDWSHDAEYIRPGVSLRTTSYIVESKFNLTLDPMVQFEIKLGRIRWANQFGFVCPVGRPIFDILPVFTVGLEYAW